MCDFWSCLVTKDKTVYSKPGVDNHHELVELFNLKDDTDIQSKLKFARVEILPPNGDPFSPLSDWNFEVDERIIPEWFSPAHEDVCLARLKEDLKSMLISSDTDLIKDNPCVFIKDCTVGTISNSVIKEMSDSSVVERMSDSSVVKRMSDSSVVKRMSGSSVCSRLVLAPWLL